jgi:hypothetical protein
MRYFPEEQGYRTRCGSSASGLYLAVGDIAVEDLEAAVHLRLARTDEGRPYLSVELTGARFSTAVIPCISRVTVSSPAMTLA